LTTPKGKRDANDTLTCSMGLGGTSHSTISRLFKKGRRSRFSNDEITVWHDWIVYFFAIMTLAVEVDWVQASNASNTLSQSLLCISISMKFELNQRATSCDIDGFLVTQFKCSIAFKWFCLDNASWMTTLSKSCEHTSSKHQSFLLIRQFFFFAPTTRAKYVFEFESTVYHNLKRTKREHAYNSRVPFLPSPAPSWWAKKPLLVIKLIMKFRQNTQIPKVVKVDRVRRPNWSFLHLSLRISITQIGKTVDFRFRSHIQLEIFPSRSL